jgi:hypothetical protein
LEVWGKTLLGLGVLSILTGMVLAGLLALFPAVIAETDLTVAESAFTGVLCCLGPCGVLGLALGVVGGVLWTTSKD